MVQCNKKSFSLIRAYLFILFVFLFIYHNDSVNAQIIIKKYINAEVLVFNKLTKERAIFKIPAKSSITYKNFNIKVNSCFKIMDKDQDFVTNITLEHIYEDRIEESENIEGQFIEIRILDKVSSKSNLVKLRIGEEKKFKNLSIKSLKCKNSEFDDNPEITAYIQVQDLTNNDNDEVFIFNGWTFLSSPTINPFDHPVYDIWLIKCY